MALCSSCLFSLGLTAVIVLAGLGYTVGYYYSSKSKKCKRILGWLALANLSLFIWALFHLFQDVDLFPPHLVDVIHYWFSHSFIVVVSVVIAYAARLAYKK